jgi:hypothetical protein
LLHATSPTRSLARGVGDFGTDGGKSGEADNGLFSIPFAPLPGLEEVGESTTSILLRAAWIIIALNIPA